MSRVPLPTSFAQGLLQGTQTLAAADQAKLAQAELGNQNAAIKADIEKTKLQGQVQKELAAEQSRSFDRLNQKDIQIADQRAEVQREQIAAGQEEAEAGRAFAEDQAAIQMKASRDIAEMTLRMGALTSDQQAQLQIETRRAQVAMLEGSLKATAIQNKQAVAEEGQDMVEARLSTQLLSQVKPQIAQNQIIARANLNLGESIDTSLGLKIERDDPLIETRRDRAPIVRAAQSFAIGATETFFDISDNVLMRMVFPNEDISGKRFLELQSKFDTMSTDELNDLIFTQRSDIMAEIMAENVTRETPDISRAKLTTTLTALMQATDTMVKEEGVDRNDEEKSKEQFARLKAIAEGVPGLSPAAVLSILAESVSPARQRADDTRLIIDGAGFSSEGASTKATAIMSAALLDGTARIGATIGHISHGFELLVTDTEAISAFATSDMMNKFATWNEKFGEEEAMNRMRGVILDADIAFDFVGTMLTSLQEFSGASSDFQEIIDLGVVALKDLTEDLTEQQILANQREVELLEQSKEQRRTIIDEVFDEDEI
jgi:hypothetical protein